MRIALWWSFHVAASSTKEVVDFYVPVLEERLGIGLQVRSEIRPDTREPSFYHLEAWSYLEAGTLEQAACATLFAALVLTERVALSDTLNLAPHDANDALIHLSWENCEAAGLPAIRSSRVRASYSPQADPSTWSELADYEPGERSEVESWRKDVLAASVLELDPGEVARRDYRIDFDLRIYSATSARLIESHWPDVRRKWFNNNAELIQVAKRSYDRGPFRLTVRKYLYEVTQDQAISTCLQFGAHDGLTLTTDDNGSVQSLSALHATQDQGTNNIVGYTLTPM